MAIWTGCIFILQGAKLTEGGSNLKRLYTGKYDLNGKRYTITFPSHLADIGTGTIIIKDGIVDSVKITKDTTNNQTSIEFNTEEKYHFEIIYRGDVNNTAINLLKPASKRRQTGCYRCRTWWKGAWCCTWRNRRKGFKFRYSTKIK